MSHKEILEKAIQRASATYESSRAGRIWNKKSGKEVKGSVNTNGYLCFKVYIPELKVSKRIYHHRFIAQTRISNPDDLPCVNHKDGNKMNNAVWNLEWCTHKQNMAHAWGKGLVPKPPHVPGEKAGAHKLTWENVKAIRLMKTEGSTNVAISKMFGLHQSTIARIANGFTWRTQYLGENT
jgi:hypothetical protein